MADEKNIKKRQKNKVKKSTLSKKAKSGSSMNSLSRRIERDWQKNWFAYLIFVPVIVWYVVFCYLPMWGILIAFKDYKPLLGFRKSKTGGLQHFRDFFG